MICPACKKDALQESSTGEEFMCQACKTPIGLYDKTKQRVVPAWILP